MINEKVSMAEMIEYSAGIPDSPGSNPLPPSRLRRQNFSLVISTIFVRENGWVFGCWFQREKFRNDRKFIQRKENLFYVWNLEKYIYIKKNILRLLEKKKKKKIRNCVWFGKLLEKWEKLKTTRKSNCCGCFYKYLYEKNETFYVNNLRVLNILAIYQGRNGDYFAIAFKEIVCKKSRKKRRRGVSCWISIK